MQIDCVVSHMTDLSLTNVFVCLHTGARAEDNAVIHENNTRGVVRFKRVLQIHILEELPRKRYQVHQHRAPDLCAPTFQLITEYTLILDSRSQTNHIVRFFKFVSFFLSWVSKTQPNHWTKRMANTRLGAKNLSRTGGPEHYLVYGRPNQIPNLVGKTAGLACILGPINSHNQSP